MTREAHERAARIEAAAMSAAFPEVPQLEPALRRATVTLIAEVKRRSPSRGDINAAIDSAGQARAYAKGGAAAISVLTEPSRFGGTLDDITKVRSSTTIPVLKKDFHVSEMQLLEARAAGASAALIIVRALPPNRVMELAGAGRAIGLELLFEIRDEAELRVALDAGARMIGVNNRNLETLEIDPTTVERVLPLVPPELVAIAESGYSSAEGVERAASAGADAVLIGSHLSASPDPAGAVASLSSITKRSRGGIR